MKANELMIGDWVQFADGTPNVMIVGIKMDARYRGDDPIITVENNRYHWIEKSLDELKPIPLTDEILVANGFCLLGDAFWWYKDFHITLSSSKALTLVCGRTIQFKYVHELQHALRLCGIDKEIEL